MPEVSRHEPGAFCWAELATSDSGAAKKFYTALFDWGYEDLPAGPDMIYTTLKKGDKRAAALYALGPEQKGVPPHWNTYVSVASADQTARKAKELGGNVLMEPFDVMDFGRMAIVEDQEGARICLWEPKSHIGVDVINEPNSLCWAELDTTDTDSARRFYTALFGWGAKVGGEAANQTEYTEWQLGGTSIGGLMKIPKEWGPVPPSWLIYFAVTDCDATARKAGDLGGETIVPPADIPDAGRFAVLRDPQGAAFALYKMPGT
ncbi:MAG TPA: VOC family protein [Thermoanaerobaculia bacterium]|nr:VOC family protein [Thermoanaerobaculia bacterium]